MRTTRAAVEQGAKSALPNGHFGAAATRGGLPRVAASCPRRTSSETRWIGQRLHICPAAAGTGSARGRKGRPEPPLLRVSAASVRHQQPVAAPPAVPPRPGSTRRKAPRPAPQVRPRRRGTPSSAPVGGASPSGERSAPVSPRPPEGGGTSGSAKHPAAMGPAHSDSTLDTTTDATPRMRFSPGQPWRYRTAPRRYLPSFHHHITAATSTTTA